LAARELVDSSGAPSRGGLCQYLAERMASGGRGFRQEPPLATAESVVKGWRGEEICIFLLEEENMAWLLSFEMCHTMESSLNSTLC